MKTKRTIRRLNYGQGDLFNFHGAFTEKKAAEAKESEVPGAFIKTVWYRGGPRYGVLTRNPKKKLSHAAVKYESPSKRGAQMCANCIHFIPGTPPACTGVQSPIRPHDWCKRFKAGKKQNAAVNIPLLRAVVDKFYPGKRPEQLRKDQLRHAVRYTERLQTKRNPFGVLSALGALSDASAVKSLLRGKSAKRGKARSKKRRKNVEWGTYEKGIFHPWTRRPKTRKKKAKRRLNTNADTSHVHTALRRLFPGKTIAQLSVTQLSQVMRAAQDLKLGKPITKRGNPSKRNYEDATELYTKFHGRGPRATVTARHHLNSLESRMLPVADYGTHPELAQLGKTVSVQFGPNDVRCTGKELKWEGSRHAPDLAAEPNGRQVFFIGGQQSVDVNTIPWDVPAFDKDYLLLGYAYKIEYFTQKSFDNFQPVTYWHRLGEEDGVLPKLVYDPKEKRLHFVYGNYVVRPEGIVN